MEIEAPKYPKFNLSAEVGRLNLVRYRDGDAAARDFAKFLIKVYLGASLNTRNKFRHRKHPYRFIWIEGAMSARHLLRTGFV